MAKALMIQGTSSNVGKSIIVTALCRIFKQDGYRVVPFKAQNMALNSYVTSNGEEIGRAQAVQAQAAGLQPRAEMNPILLKPAGDASSQVVVMGKPLGKMSARDYRLGRNLKLLKIIESAFRTLEQEFEIIVIEGAGSPAEVNLKDRDIANMRTAALAKAPVLLAADIDRGGALASVVGTLALLEPEEVAMVKGIILNKFRGDLALLEPALDFLASRTGKPVFGVLPYLSDLYIPAEDSVCLEKQASAGGSEIEIAVIYLPRISNFTDFDALALEPGIKLRYVKEGESLGSPDMIIIPGTKNTIEDLLYLYETGFAAAIRKAAANGTPVCGLCGGFQMLGRELRDPEHVESSRDDLPGLGLLDTVTDFSAEKILAQATGEISKNGAFIEGIQGLAVKGYEIHMGKTVLGEEAQPLINVHEREGVAAESWDGAVNLSGTVWGTYFHGIFDNDLFRNKFLNWLRAKKGLSASSSSGYNHQEFVEQGFDLLAESCRANLNMGAIYELLNLPGTRRTPGK